jgi:hypothetical protein
MTPSPEPGSSVGAGGPPHRRPQVPVGEGGSRQVATRFRAAWADEQNSGDPGPELLPTRLSRACLAVLPVDGVGLSLFENEFRVPMGASDDVAALAERLQFTLGEGPCLDAAHERRMQVADQDQLAERWPLYSHELFNRTPFRGIAAVPLALSPDTFAALDLFVADSARLPEVSLTDVTTLSEEIVDALILAQALSPPPSEDTVEDSEPVWLRSPATRGRTLVWVAMGMMMTEFDLVAPDALALLRSYAYSNDTDLDEVAADLAHGKLELSALRP